MPRLQLPALVPPGLEFLSTDFTAPAPPWGNPCLSAALLSPPVSAPGSYVPPPAILQVRKKNFVFLWDTVISGRFSATWTVTGSGACILNTAPPGEKSPLRSGNGCAAITGLTAGRVMDYGLKDSMNMGGCMAPAACDTIARNFSDFGRKPSDYDAVFTGDLGIIGQKILLDLLSEQNIQLSPIHKDCGILIYDNPSQDTHAGGSGCGCSAVVLASYILPKVVSGEWKRILFVPTGALLSKVSFNEGDSIPGIAHGVVIEHMEV